jgi:hypothetical protein
MVIGRLVRVARSLYPEALVLANPSSTISKIPVLSRRGRGRVAADGRLAGSGLVEVIWD